MNTSMLPQNNPTNPNESVEPETRAAEQPVEEPQTEVVEAAASAGQPAAVEEIDTAEKPSTGNTVSYAKPASKKYTPPVKKEDPSPLELDPYEFDKCTITVVYTHISDEQVSVSVHNHKDEPMVKTFLPAEVPMPAHLANTIMQLLSIWPEGKVSVTMVLLPAESEGERKMVVSTRVGNDTPIVQSGPASEFEFPAPILALLQELKAALPERGLKKLERDAKANAKTKVTPNAKTVPPKTTAAKPAPVVVEGKIQTTLF